MGWKGRVASAAAGLVLAAGMDGGMAAVAQSVTPVPQLDMTKFAGTWYEQARLADKDEKRCVGDGVRLYALGDKARRFQGVNSCRVQKGYPQVQNKDGRVHNKNGDGSLEISWLVFFHKRTWVLAVAPDYSWAVMGSPDHRTLWLLTRVPQVDASVLTEMRGRAAAEGFDVSKLMVVPQSLAPRTPVPQAEVKQAAP